MPRGEIRQYLSALGIRKHIGSPKSNHNDFIAKLDARKGSTPRIRKHVMSKPIPSHIRALQAPQGYLVSSQSSTAAGNPQEKQIRAAPAESGIRRLTLTPDATWQAVTSEKSLVDAIGEVRLSRPRILITGEVEEIRTMRKKAKSAGRTVALVPTMGALHAGHLRLIREAARSNHEVYVSIYVNPTQFGMTEDLKSYPKTMDRDLDLLHNLNKEFERTPTDFLGRVSTVFNPLSSVMYPCLPPTSEPDGHGSFISITPLSKLLEGASRPVFFRGVATVVMKLLSIVQPDKVVFGQKDIQQVLVIRRMIKDFHMTVKLDLVPTAREEDGLARSSRNVYLGTRRRKVAIVLVRALKAAHDAFSNRKRSREEILKAALEVAAEAQQAQRILPLHKRARFEVDYISLADPDTLEEVHEIDMDKGAILSGAVVMLPLEDPQEGEDTGLGGGTRPVRLIDNHVFFVRKIFPTESGAFGQTREKILGPQLLELDWSES